VGFEHLIAVMNELTLTYIGLGLGVGSIGVTILVAILVYKLQQKENKSRDDILNKINEITVNQATIIESLENRRRKHVDWLIHHIGGVLQSLIECYQKLVSRITAYQNTRSEAYLNRILGEIEGCRIFLIQLKGLAERDIPLASFYISEPWISGKFQDIIQVLDMGIYRNEKEIPNMTDNDFLSWKISINYQIGQMEKYLQIIKEEREK
jgi:hypothetical protein